jgi:hypothetical protein
LVDLGANETTQANAGKQITASEIPQCRKHNPINHRRSVMRKTMQRAGTLAILTVGLVLSANATAAGPQEKKAAKNSTAASGDVLTSLHQAKTLLDTAIHDYDGHRAKAVEELHHALHELSPHHHNKGAKGTGATATATKEAEKVANKEAPKGTTPGETQAQSDMQLKQALQILGGLNGQIPAAHPKASEHLRNAVSELNVALKIK